MRKIRSDIRKFCENCGSEFVRKEVRKFCSQNCYHQSGRTWNKGLTKQSDNRVAKYAEKVKRNHHDCSGANNSMFGRRGELAPNWNPDREYIKWKALMYKMGKSLVYRAIKKGFRKSKRTFEELGYNPQQLREHLESLFVDGMSWENYGDSPGCWHVDHIRPVSSFPEGTPANVVNALTNLRPLWRDENHRKWAKWQPFI